VNGNSPRLIWLNDSGLSCLLTLLLVGFLLGSVGLGWIVNGFFILLAILLVVPVVAVWGFRWWLKSNLVEDRCPACSYEFTGFNRTECQCPNCGEPLKVEGGRFKRLTPPGTIDVEAVEVTVQRLEE
jgi:ribosomal protein S27E